MDGKITWRQGMAFTGAAASGFQLPLGAGAAVGGENDGFRPLELVGLGLAGCTAMDVVSILVKKRQRLSAFEVQVHTEQAQEHPKVFTQGVLEYIVTGVGVEEEAVRRAIELSVTRYCPAHAMLAKAFPMRFLYRIYEQPLEGGEPVLTANGVYASAAPES